MKKILWAASFTQKPVSTNNAYPTRRNGGRYISQEGKSMRDQIQWFCKTTFKKSPSIKPLEVEIEYTFADKRTRDVGNYDKLLIDSLSGFIFKDDVQIQKLTLSKRTGTNWLTTIKIWEIST